MATDEWGIMQNCLLCREVAGAVFLPGGLHPGDEVVAFHLPEQPSGDVLLGHHLVVPMRHALDHAELTDIP